MGCTVADTSNVWKFEIDGDNTGEMSVSDPLLDDAGKAEERAMSEFLKNAYSVREISFSTYRTDKKLNDTVNIAGVPFLIKKITYAIDEVKTTASFAARRYD